MTLNTRLDRGFGSSGSKPQGAALSTPDLPWLVLIYQLPSRPSNARVKAWRRLQKLGAAALRNSAYILPNSPQAREDLEWIKTEIVAMKGQATVFLAASVDPFAADEIVRIFQSAREGDFNSLRRDIQKLLDKAGQRPTTQSLVRRRLGRAVRVLREHWNELVTIDFFRAPGRDEAVSALEKLERLAADTRGPSAPDSGIGGVLVAEKFRNRTWITRPRPGIDRMGSAWLIRRFIDPGAKFSFGEKIEKGSALVPFDMFGVEFSHHGNACTFETLTSRFGIASPAVQRLGQIVHDLDLRDDRYAAPEAAAIGRLVDGLRLMHEDNRELLEQGMAMFEALYRSFGDSPSSHKSPAQSISQRRKTGSRRTLR